MYGSGQTISVSSFVKGANNAILAPHKIFVKVKIHHGHVIALKHYILFRWEIGFIIMFSSFPSIISGHTLHSCNL